MQETPRDRWVTHAAQAVPLMAADDEQIRARFSGQLQQMRVHPVRGRQHADVNRLLGKITGRPSPQIVPEHLRRTRRI